MPRDGAMVLTDLPEDKLRLVCRRCALRRQYDIAQLVGKVGNAKLPGLIQELAKRSGCPKVPAPSLYDRCGIVMTSGSAPEWLAGSGSSPALSPEWHSPSPKFEDGPLRTDLR